ncbi:MAG: PhoH family protein [Candidatus Eisenbacteria bacterium]|nr:PhoH family protein [Candidatus Eisenbacteria bacterium]
MKETVHKIVISDIDPIHLLGQNDVNLRLIEDKLPVRIVLRDGVLTVKGDARAVEKAARVIGNLLKIVREGKSSGEADVRYVLDLIESGTEKEISGVGRKSIAYALDKQIVSGRTVGQIEYLEAMEKYDIVFSIGPAGTGKTYLAVAAAVNALRARKVERILLVRPAVEAGESLGFLPGDFKEKVDPYLRPIYDAISDMMSYEKMRRFVELGVIEIAPLAYMRGRTLGNAYAILDEAQNTTVGQMKMFLTRLGENSKAVITGDITQIDLANGIQSGLVEAQTILSGINDVRFVYLTERDVVRHRLVKDIIKAFDEYGRSKETGGIGGKA